MTRIVLMTLVTMITRLFAGDNGGGSGKPQQEAGSLWTISRRLKGPQGYHDCDNVHHNLLHCEFDIHDLTLCAGGKAQQRLPLADVDQGGADGERLPQEPLTEPGEETINNEDVVSDPRNEPNIWGREQNCGKNE